MGFDLPQIDKLINRNGNDCYSLEDEVQLSAAD